MSRVYKSTGYKRRHYEDLARILGEARNVDDVTSGLLVLFSRDNPRFDADRFMRAVSAHAAGQSSGQ